jgi:alkylation response protein AidB-like acyl-CoA dehydrogenase
MDFKLSAEEAHVFRGARKVAKLLEPRALKWQGEWPAESVRTLAEHGYLAISLPEDCGGLGLSPLYTALVMEAIGETCPDSAQAVRFTNFGPANHIAQLGTPEQKAKYVLPVARGEQLIAIAISEPEAGSAANNMRTTARIEGDEVVINGYKVYCSEADIATAYVVMLRFPDGVGSVIVDRGTPGLELAALDENMFGGKQGHLSFTECRIPKANILAGGEQAFKQEFAVYNFGRLGSAMIMIAAANCALHHALEYVKIREQFDTKIIDFQGIRWMLAEMVTKLEAARYLTYRALSNAAEPGARPSRVESSIAKLYATEMARDVVDGSLQFFGASGFMKGSALEYLYRFVRGSRISGGTSQIQKNMIASDVIRKGLPELAVHGE